MARIWRRNAKKHMLESPYFDFESAQAQIGTLDDQIAELNAEILEAHAGSVPELQWRWRALDAAARRRLARCPFLLADAGLARPTCWSGPPNFAVHEAAPQAPSPAGRSALATPLLRRVLLLAWYLARGNRMAARIALGMSGSSANLLARWRQADLDALAERRPAWIHPRWDQNLEVWCAWLGAAAQQSSRGLERLHLWGLQKLAADVRRQTGVRSSAALGTTDAR
jgi:hypothetical protein